MDKELFLLTFLFDDAEVYVGNRNYLWDYMNLLRFMWKYYQKLTCPMCKLTFVHIYLKIKKNTSAHLWGPPSCTYNVCYYTILFKPARAPQNAIEKKNKSARSTSGACTEVKTDAVNTSNIVTRPQSRINRPNSLDTYVNRTTIPLIVYLIWFLLQYSDGIQRILVLPAHLISSQAPGMCAVAFSGLKDHWYGHTGFGFFKIFMREQRWEFAFRL